MITFISFLIVMFGSVNWLSVGMLQFDLVAALFGTQSSIFSRIIYIIVGFAAIWITVQCVRQKGKLNIVKDRLNVPALDKKDEQLAEKIHQE